MKIKIDINNFSTPDSWEEIFYDSSIEWPKISIITPSFNQGVYIEQTILSVINQNYPNLEYIIMDGGSTDQTVEIIKRYEKSLAYWESTPDKGQSDAINKGIKYVTGSIVNWLNSDDFLTRESLKKIALQFIQEKGLKMLSGRSRMFDIKGTKFISGTTYYNPNNLSDTLNKLHIEQPATFFTTEVFREITPLCGKLHYVMDKEMLLKFYLKYFYSEIRVMDDILVNFRHHEDSKTISVHQKFINEHATLLYSLAKQKGFQEYANYFEQYYLVNEEYSFEFSCLEDLNAKLVESMIVFFLFKYSNQIFTKEEFHRAFIFLKLIKKKNDVIDKAEYKKLKRKVIFGFWTLFKARRKILHYLVKS